MDTGADAGYRNGYVKDLFQRYLQLLEKKLCAFGQVEPSIHVLTHQSIPLYTLMNCNESSQIL